TGSYAVELTNNGCVDTSACEVISSLPIELLSFEARRNQSRVDFKWVTATEINNDYFTIERSEDLDTWHEVFSLPGAGNSTEVREYTGSDDRPLVGTGYYRLKQTDFDGQYAYSKVEVVDGSTQSEIRLYPNPTTSELTIEGLGVDAKRISLLDVRGKDLTSQVYFSQDSGIRVVVDLANLRSGVYFIRVGGSVHTINKN
ncbi:MAG TPA: hypothetical protein DCR93_22435, partial [Cytophagales bacterium]|nr:hypothetical protein [Cytophagales bacterium]